MEGILISATSGLNTFISQRTGFTIRSMNHVRKIMEEDTITLNFLSAKSVSLPLGSYIVHRGQKFTLKTIVDRTKKNAHHFEYNAIFEGAIYDLNNYLFFNQDVSGWQNSSAFFAIGDLKFFLDLIINNTNRIGDLKWSYSEIPQHTKELKIQFQSDSCLSALKKISEAFELKFDVTGEGDHRIIRVLSLNKNDFLTLEYGHLKGLNQINAKGDKETVKTRVYYFGSNKNLPTIYPLEGEKRSSRLLPNGSNEPFISTELEETTGVKIEGMHIFEDIYPTRKGKITGTSRDPKEIFDYTLDFDINKTLTSETAKINMLTGKLAGYTFEIKAFKNSEKKITVIPTEDLNGVAIPSNKTSAFRFEIGDEYVLTGVKLPEAYVKAAEKKLFKEAEKHFNKMLKHEDQFVGLTLDPQFVGTLKDDIDINHNFKIIDMDLGIDDVYKVEKIDRSIFKNNQYTPNVISVDIIKLQEPKQVEKEPNTGHQMMLLVGEERLPAEVVGATFDFSQRKGTRLAVTITGVKTPFPHKVALYKDGVLLQEKQRTLQSAWLWLSAVAEKDPKSRYLVIPSSGKYTIKATFTAKGAPVELTKEVEFIVAQEEQKTEVMDNYPFMMEVEETRVADYSAHPNNRKENLPIYENVYTRQVYSPIHLRNGKSRRPGGRFLDTTSYISRLSFRHQHYKRGDWTLTNIITNDVLKSKGLELEVHSDSLSHAPYELKLEYIEDNVKYTLTRTLLFIKS